MGAFEGHGATLTLGTTGITLLCTSIQGQGIAWAAVDTTHLATANARTFVRGDLYDPGTISVTYLSEQNTLDGLIASSASETITITYPVVALTNGAKEASTGFITNIDSGNMEVDAVSTGSLTIKRTGAVTFTDEN